VKNVFVGSLLVLLATACGSSSNGSGGSGGSGGETTNATMTGAGGGAPAGFECIGNVMLPAAGADTGVVTLGLTDSFGSTGPIASAHVVLCAKDDMMCGTSLAAGDSGADGTVALTVPFGPNGFDGYGIVTKQGYFPTLLAASIPYVPADGTSQFTLAEQATATPILKQAFGIDLDATKGDLIVVADDCNGKSAAGVTIQVTGVDFTYFAYNQNGQPEMSAKETDATGTAIAINMAPGVAQVETRVTSSNELIATASVFIKANTLSEIYMAPTP